MEQITINLGKININKVKTSISELEFKGKTRTEIKSYLDYATQEYKESKTDLTNLFGDVDNKIIEFLNGLYTKYNEINESNFKNFLEEIRIFTGEYVYKIEDIRQPKEELIKQRAEREAQQKTAEEQKAKEEAEIKASGNITIGEKINLGTKEIAKQIREKIKNKYPSCVFSVVKESYSMGSSITISLMSSNFKVMPSYSELSEEAILNYADNDQRTREQLKEMQEGNYQQLTSKISEEYNKDVWNNGVFLTEAGHKLFKGVMEIVNYYNYNNSDSQTDYYDVNFHCELRIGKYDKPYILEEGATAQTPPTATATEQNSEEITFKHNTDKNGLEIYFKSKPSEEIRNKLKSQGFRWGRFNKCWYKRFNEGLEQEIKTVLGVA